MIRFKSLSIQNFLSYGAVPTVINLDPGGTTLIVGQDLDNTASGTGANGVGKTVWLNALVFALYGSPVSKISLDNLVNNINNTHLEVILEFQKDDELIVVKRVRKEKGLGSYARVYRRKVGEELDMSVRKENKQDVTPDSVANINAYIEDVLGIPHELFVRIVAFSATSKPFLDMSGPDQGGFMEELFRLNRLSEKAVQLKKVMKDSKASLEIKKKHNEQLEKEHERHSELLKTAIERVKLWDFDKKEDIAELEKKLKELSVHDIEGQQKLFDEVTKQNNVVTALTTTLGELQHKNAGFAAEHKAATTEIDMLEDQVKGMQGKMDTWDEEHKANVQAHEDAKEGLVAADVLESQRKFHERYEELRSKKKDFDLDISTLSTRREGIEKARAEAETELSHLEDATCPYCEQKYESAEDKIAACNANIATYTKDMDDVDAEVKEKKIELADCLSDLEKVEKTITHELDEIATEEKLREDLFKKIDELNAMTNPYNMDDLVEAEKRIVELNKKLEELTKSVTDTNFHVVSTNKSLEIEEEALTKLVEQIKFKSLEELWEVKGNITRTEEKLSELKNQTNPHKASLDELEAIELEPIDMDTINKLDKLITHQTYLLKLLTKKDSFIRKNLLDKNLAFLNQRLHGYLSDLGLPHRVEFTQEMTAHISQFGRQLDFGNLSSGQKARVNLALSFSFRDVLQRSLDSVNVCMLDEVLDVGLDSVGVQNAAHMLKRKAREDELTLFIISHRDEVSGIFDKTLTVTMERGFSHVNQAA